MPVCAALQKLRSRHRLSNYPPPGAFKKGIRGTGTCFMTRLLNICVVSEVCTVEQSKRGCLWLRQIIDPHHKTSNNSSDKEKYCYFHSAVQRHEGGTVAQLQQLQHVARTPAFVTILFRRISGPAEHAAGSTRVREAEFGPNSIGKSVIGWVVCSQRRVRLCSSLRAFKCTILR